MKKYILMFLFFLLVLYLTFYNIYDPTSFSIMADSIKEINILYFVILSLIVFLYFLLQGIYMKTILKTLNNNITLKKGLFYSLVEFYFSGITPSSTGGQPVQLVFMTKDKIPIRKSYIVLILNTIYFKLIVLLLGLLVLWFSSSYVLNGSFWYTFFFILGLVVDIVIVFVGFLLLFKQKLIKKMVSGLVKSCRKLGLFKRKMESINVDETLKKYKSEVTYIKEHKLQVFLMFILTFIQRLLLFSVSYVVYRALGFNSCSYFKMLAIQISIQVTIEAFPLPGGTGISENMLRDILIGFIGVGFAEAGMVITRLFTFYIPLVISGIIIFVYAIKNNLTKRKKRVKI